MPDIEQIFVRREHDVRLCAQTIGDRADPAVLLIGGATWSMDWWETEFCHQVVGRGLRVVRYDQRDTGQSSTCPAGSPTYTSSDLVADAEAVLDGFGIDRAHVVGLSMGGGVAQRMALAHRDRVATLTLMSTSPIDPTIGDLPGPTAEILATFTSDDGGVDWHDRDAAVEAIVEGERPYAGPGNFDEQRQRALATQVFDRSIDMAAGMTNHFMLDTSTPLMATWVDLPMSQRSSSTAPPTRCSRSSTAEPWRGRSPAPASSSSRTSATNSPLRRPGPPWLMPWPPMRCMADRQLCRLGTIASRTSRCGMARRPGRDPLQVTSPAIS